MKKTIFIGMLFFLSQFSFSQSTECTDGGTFQCGSLADRGEIIITPLSQLGCKELKGNLYAMFPRITIYAGYVFKEITRCSSNDIDPYQGQLKFTYCMPETCLEMRVTIYDFKDSFFQTDAGKMHKSIYLMPFDPTPAAAMMGAHLATSIDKFDKEVVVSTRFGSMGGESDAVSYLAYDQERYFIAIEIDDKNKRFTEPIQVENFVSGYAKQIKL